jgi:hypothetical protein
MPMYSTWLWLKMDSTIATHEVHEDGFCGNRKVHYFVNKHNDFVRYRPLIGPDHVVHAKERRLHEGNVCNPSHIVYGVYEPMYIIQSSHLADNL